MKILCFGTHPDDIEFGMGGTLIKLAKAGNDITLFVSRECTNERFEEQKKSNKILNVSQFKIDSFTYHTSSEMSEICVLTEIIQKIQPERVYIPCIYDSNQHHRRLGKMVMAALRRTTISCYMYFPSTIRPVMVERFHPHVYEDTSLEFEDKLKAIRCHQSQIERYGTDYLDYVKHKDAGNGYEIGVDYAEVFQIVKEVRK